MTAWKTGLSLAEKLKEKEQTSAPQLPDAPAATDSSKKPADTAAKKPEPKPAKAVETKKEKLSESSEKAATKPAAVAEKAKESPKVKRSEPTPTAQPLTPPTPVLEAKEPVAVNPETPTAPNNAPMPTDPVVPAPTKKDDADQPLVVLPPQLAELVDPSAYSFIGETPAAPKRADAAPFVPRGVAAAAAAAPPTYHDPQTYGYNQPAYNSMGSYGHQGYHQNTYGGYNQGYAAQPSSYRGRGMAQQGFQGAGLFPPPYAGGRGGAYRGAAYQQAPQQYGGYRPHYNAPQYYNGYRQDQLPPTGEETDPAPL